MGKSAVLTPAMREAVADVLDRRPASMAITLRYNDWPISLDRIRRDVSRLHAMIDRRIYGRRFHLSPQRTSGWWIVEKLDCSPHLHGALDLPPDHAGMLADGLWERVAGLRSEHDARPYTYGWSRYTTKILTDMAHLILAEDFGSNRTDT